MENCNDDSTKLELYSLLTEAEEEVESGVPLLDADIVFAELESKYFNNGRKLFRYE